VEFVTIHQNKEVKLMPIYAFYYDGGETEFWMEIEADKETVEKLLNEYRESDPEEYNDLDWCEFLKSKGIKARFLDPDYYIYF